MGIRTRMELALKVAIFKLDDLEALGALVFLAAAFLDFAGGIDSPYYF